MLHENSEQVKPLGVAVSGCLKIALCVSVVLTEIVTMMEAVIGSFVQWIEKAIQRMNGTKSY